MAGGNNLNKGRKERGTGGERVAGVGRGLEAGRGNGMEESCASDLGGKTPLTLRND